MQKFNSRFIFLCLFYISIFILFPKTFRNGLIASSNDYQKNDEYFSDYDLDDDDEINDNLDLGQFTEIYQEIENLIISFEEIEDSMPTNIKENFISEWTKTSSRYLLKKVKKLFSKFVNTDKEYTLDDVAYNVAKFKRSIDRIYNTGSVDDLFCKMCQHIPKEVDASIFYPFKERVEFFYTNRKTRPKDLCKLTIFNDIGLFICDEEEIVVFKMDSEYMIYGAEVFCGALICVLPFPGARGIGGLIAGDGGRRILNHFIDVLNRKSDQNGRISRGDSAQSKMRDLENLKMIDFYYKDAA